MLRAKRLHIDEHFYPEFWMQRNPLPEENRELVFTFSIKWASLPCYRQGLTSIATDLLLVLPLDMRAFPGVDIADYRGVNVSQQIRKRFFRGRIEPTCLSWTGASGYHGSSGEGIPPALKIEIGTVRIA